MNFYSNIGYGASVLALVLALVSLLVQKRSVAGWCFFIGMLILAAESIFGSMALGTLDKIRGANLGVEEAGEVQKAVFWLTMGLAAKAFIPGVWLCFSLSYSRGNARECLREWRIVVILAFLLPVGLVIGFWSDLLLLTKDAGDGSRLWIAYGGGAKALNVGVLLATILILAQIERTFHSAVGTMRWKVKFLVLGLAVIFGTKIYTLSQGILFTSFDFSTPSIDSGSLIVGCLLMAVGSLRSGFAELDIYPSSRALQGSLTVVITGVYLFLVGVLAQLVKMLGGAEAFAAQAFVVLLGVVTLAILLLSDRFRLWVRQFVSRHFKRPEYDFRKIWTRFSQRLSRIIQPQEFCVESSKLISETFNALSVDIYLIDRHRNLAMLSGSTSGSKLEGQGSGATSQELDGSLFVEGLKREQAPFDLEAAKGELAEVLRATSSRQFEHGGRRICVPLRVGGGSVLGAAVLGDRVEGVPYTPEEFELLECIAEEISAGLANRSLTEELVKARELEAFQTMSAFFVHDLKNAASSLNLTLQNLPIHYDDPAFREDALRGIAKTAGRINQLTERLGKLRKKLEYCPVESDLNEIIKEALADFKGTEAFTLKEKLDPLPLVMLDREQIGSVVTNLLNNAREAVGNGGNVTIGSSSSQDRVVVYVEDDGCGMSADFIRDSLFKPFRSTKKQGLGIGMFQSRMIVEAHRGRLRVESEKGKGTMFRFSLPVGSNGEE